MQLEDFAGRDIPRYSILSHCWGEEEVNFGHIDGFDWEMMQDWRDKAGHAKIYYACHQSEADNLDYTWIDTCCIDKSNNAELSESINSMYSW